MKKVKAGLALLTAEWFSQIRLDVSQDPETNITLMAEANTRLAIETLEPYFELVLSWGDAISYPGE